MAWRNTSYRGPDIMISLMRATNIPWQVRSMRNRVLISKSQYRDRYPGNNVTTLRNLFERTAPGYKRDLRIPGTYMELSGRELRDVHSGTSDPVNDGTIRTPASNYVSMTSSVADTNWGQGFAPTVKFKFDIWRSDVWKGAHDLTRDPVLQLSLLIRLAMLPHEQRQAVFAEQTPPDWNRGLEFEWLATGGTRIYNVCELQHGAWVPSVPTNNDVDFWWEALN